MGLHVVVLPESRDLKSRLAFVVGDRVLLTDDERTVQQISELLNGESWLAPTSMWHESDVVGAFNNWWTELPAAPPDIVPLERAELAAMGVMPGAPRSGMMPVPPRIIYGHLPFAVVHRSDVFYRYEPFPTSRRIDQVNRKVTLGTFACPASEGPFVQSGFAAVGRFALPNLLPACFRWELQPISGTRMRCGASVPLYGQAGGGVEVCFDAGLLNRGPIANPVTVPAL